MCRVLNVSATGYYAWRKRPACPRREQDATLRKLIVTSHQRSRKTYGTRRIQADLSDAKVACGRKRISRLMREAGVEARCKRAFRVTTTNSKHSKRIAPNLLDRHFAPAEIEATNRVWVGDITYIRTAEGWLYLAVVIELFSRRVIGWSMSHSMETRLVLDALTMALDTRRPIDLLIWHTDRGVQYADEAMQRLQEQRGVLGSMSRKGNCWDNAVAESFFGTLKRELIDGFTFETREAARSAIFEYIEVWYNRYRRHSTLGYVSPEQFELAQLV